MIIPDGEKELVKFALDVKETCLASQGQRGSAYRQYGQWIETGMGSGRLSLGNVLYSHVDRLAAHLFTPVDLRFTIDFEQHYEADWLTKAEVAAKALSREWERRSIDLVFARGVREALCYGAAVMKQLTAREWDSETKSWVYRSVAARLVMPWQFGVYNESVNVLGREQEAMCETVWITKAEAWRRISGFPDRDKLMKRIGGTASAGGEHVPSPGSFMHQVLSTAVLDTTGVQPNTPQPGGVVNLGNGADFTNLGPMTGADLIPFHEITVWDDERDDWTTIQIIEPDILIAPRYKRCNLYCPDTLCYTLVQPNQVEGYFWGRSEVVDLITLQGFLSTTLDDIKRIFGQQVDKLLAFPGFDGMTDETYAAFRSQGFVGMPQGSSVQDLTPKMPAEAGQIVKMILEMIDRVSGFPPILSGMGESGVRAGAHADVLQKTASPRLLDRSLLVERQCAEAGDATLCAMEAKNPQVFWTDAGKEDETSFYLAQLPDDRRVSVDSHSSSPVYQTDHQNMIAFGLKAGLVDPISAIEQLRIPNAALLIERYKASQAAKAAEVKALMERDPKAAADLIAGKHGR